MSSTTFFHQLTISIQGWSSWYQLGGTTLQSMAIYTDLNSTSLSNFVISSNLNGFVRFIFLRMVFYLYLTLPFKLWQITSTRESTIWQLIREWSLSLQVSTGCSKTWTSNWLQLLSSRSICQVWGWRIWSESRINISNMRRWYGKLAMTSTKG